MGCQNVLPKWGYKKHVDKLLIIKRLARHTSYDTADCKTWNRRIIAVWNGNGSNTYRLLKKIKEFFCKQYNWSFLFGRRALMKIWHEDWKWTRQNCRGLLGERNKFRSGWKKPAWDLKRYFLVWSGINPALQGLTFNQVAHGNKTTFVFTTPLKARARNR